MCKEATLVCSCSTTGCFSAVRDGPGASEASKSDELPPQSPQGSCAANIRRVSGVAHEGAVREDEVTVAGVVQVGSCFVVARVVDTPGATPREDADAKVDLLSAPCRFEVAGSGGGFGR